MARGDCNITNICIPTRRIIYAAGFTPPPPGCNFPDGSFSQGGEICDWEYRVRYDIDPAQVPSDQTNFALSIDLGEVATDLSPSNAATFWNEVNRQNIRVTLVDGASEIPHYTHAIDNLNETGRLTALVPTVSGSVVTSIFIYFANVAATEYAVGAPLGRNAALAGFALYADMEQNPAGVAPQLSDMTGNGNNYTNLVTAGSWAAGDRIAGKVGSTWDYRGTHYSSRLHDSEPLSFRNDLEGAMSAWVNIDSLAAARQIIGFGGTASATAMIQFRVETNGSILFLNRNVNTGAADQIQTAAGVISIGNWYHIVIKAEATGYTIFVNGASVAFSVITGTNSGDWYGNCVPTNPQSTIGALRFVGNIVTLMDGKIGPAHIVSAAPTANRILTEYRNQNAPGTFATFTNFQASGL